MDVYTQQEEMIFAKDAQNIKTGKIGSGHMINFNHMKNEHIEQLSAHLHSLYQAEAKRQGDVRHHDDYQALPENIKEFDRVLARYIISREEELVKEVEGLKLRINTIYRDVGTNAYFKGAIQTIDAVLAIIKKR